MHTRLKGLLRPLLRAGCSIAEAFIGFRTDPNGYLPNRLKMLSSQYESELCKALVQAIPENGVFVDVGANVGYIGRHLLLNAAPSQVVSIEPNPGLADLIDRNLSAFGNCQVHHVALGDSPGESIMYVGKDSAVGSLSSQYVYEHQSGDPRCSVGVRPAQIRVVTGDTLLASFRQIDVLKIDVEGYELQILSGMRRLIREKRILKIFFEYHPLAQRCAGHSESDLLNFLVKNGFSLCRAEGPQKGSRVLLDRLSGLIGEIGDRGYTTLLAQLDC